MRVAMTDGEMTGLNADGWDQLLCAGIAEYQTPKFDSKGKCIKPPWANVRVIAFTDAQYENERWNDLPICEAWEAALDEYDVIVTWNGIKFDEPFLRTRKAEYGKTTKPWKRHKDLMYTARYKLKMSSASLHNVCNHLRVFDKYGIEKTETKQGRWRKAICGHKPSYNYIVKHCEHDVKVLAAVWQELIPWVTEIK